MADKAHHTTLRRLSVEGALKSAIREYGAAKWEQGQGRRSEASVGGSLNSVKTQIRALVAIAQEEGASLLATQE